MDSLPPDVDALLRAGHGLVTRPHLLRAGFPDPRIRAWRRDGLLEAVVPGAGLYRDPGAPVPPEQCAAVPLRYLGERAPEVRISGQAALALHGLEGFTLPCRPLVLVHGDRRVRLPGAPFDVRRADVASGDRRTVRGLATVGVERALADTGLDDRVPDVRLRVGFDSARRLGLTRVSRLSERLAVLPGRHGGAQRLRAMRDSGLLDLESEGERDVWLRVFLPWPPLPSRQVWILPHVRVDFVFLRAALVLEYLGRVHLEQWEADTARTWDIREAGYEILPITAGMAEDPEHVARRMHRIRLEREALADAGRLRVAPLPPQPER